MKGNSFQEWEDVQKIERVVPISFRLFSAPVRVSRLGFPFPPPPRRVTANIVITIFLSLLTRDPLRPIPLIE